MNQEHLAEKSSLYRVDKYKRFIWLKMEFGYPLFLIGCYIPHHESPFYARNGIDSSDAFDTLGLDIAELIEMGKIIVMGDHNARIGQLQFQPIMNDELDKADMIAIDALWHRTSDDDTINAKEEHSSV